MDGNVIVWNMDSHEIISSFQVDAAVYAVIIPPAAHQGSFATGKKRAPLLEGTVETELEVLLRYAQEELYLVLGASSKHKNESTPTSAIVTSSHSHKHTNVPVATDKYRLVAYDTEANKTRRRVVELQHPRQTVGVFVVNNNNNSSKGRKTVGSTEVYILAGHKRKLVVWSTESKTVVCTLLCDGMAAGSITCIDIHNGTGVVATGHEHGEVCLWHDLSRVIKQQAAGTETSAKSPAPRCTTLHWHAHAVASLGFCSEGLQLCSGGEEGVLVLWSLAASASGASSAAGAGDSLTAATPASASRSFIPRIGAAITHVASCAHEASVVLTASDNSVRVINTSTLREEWVLRHLFVSKHGAAQKRFTTPSSNGKSGGLLTTSDMLTATLLSLPGCAPADPRHRCSIAVEDRTGYLATNGMEGVLQMLELEGPVFRHSHEILQYTRVSKKEAHTKMFAPSITHFQFLKTKHGNFLCTLDVRRGEGLEAESSLKMWVWDSGRNKYRLSAQVDRPHGVCRVTSLHLYSSTSSFDNKEVHCATAAVDGTIKLWRGQQQQQAGSKDSVSGAGSGVDACSVSWSCAYSFQYRESPAHSLRASSDGSLLAVCYNNIVTLWDPVTVALKGTLVVPTPNSIFFTAFIEPAACPALGGGSGSSLLVLGSKRSLSVFNLLTMQLVWTQVGYFSSFAVAENDAACVTVGQAAGWIAACRAEAGSGDDSEGGVLDEAADAVNDTRRQYQLQLFGLASSTPLSTHALTSKARSLVFWKSNEMASSAQCVLLVTTAGELLRLDDPGRGLSVQQQDASMIRTARIAQVNRRSAPMLATDQVEHSVLVPTLHDAPVGKSQLSSLLDARSSSMPSVAELYGSVMGGQLKRAAAPSITSIPPATTARGLNTLVAFSKPINTTNVASNMTPPSFSESTQDQFDANLSSFFSKHHQQQQQKQQQQQQEMDVEPVKLPKSAKKVKPVAVAAVVAVTAESESESESVAGGRRSMRKRAGAPELPAVEEEPKAPLTASKAKRQKAVKA